MENYIIADIRDIQNYILGGRAEFVLEDVELGHHITFIVRRDIKDESLYWIKYKSLDFKLIGRIVIKQIEFKDAKYNVPIFYPLKGLLPGNDWEKMEIFQRLIKFIYFIEIIPDNIHILHTGRCSRCARTLTDPDSIRIGMGPYCRAN